MTFFTYTDPLPVVTNNPSQDVNNMVINGNSVSGILPIDHIGFNANNGGQHKRVTFNNDPSAGYPFIPATPTSPPVLFTNTVLGLPELFFYSGDAAHSSLQYTLAGNGSTFLFGGIIIKWFTVALIANTQNVSFASVGLANFPNNAFVAMVSTNNSSGTIAYTSVSASNIVITKTGSGATASVFVIGN